MQKIKRGNIFNAVLTGIGSEQQGERPVLVVQNDIGNKNSPTIIVAPLTGNIQKNILPTHVFISTLCGLECNSIALLEQIKVIDKTRLCEYLGTLDGETMRRVDKALAVSVGLENQRPLKNKVLELSLCSRCESNFRHSGYLVIKNGWQNEKTPCYICQEKLGFYFKVLDEGDFYMGKYDNTTQ